MNNRPSTGEALLDQNGRLSRGWSNWIEQIWLCLRAWKKSYTATEAIDFASVAANSQSAASTVTIVGVRHGDAVTVTPLVQTTGIFYKAHVSANDTVSVYACNFTAGAVNPASTSFRIVVLQD
jgi:hypothetical protein